jgi:signal recognition particle receptor subunit beta
MWTKLTSRQLPPILSALANLANQTGRFPRLLILAHKTDLLVRPTPPANPSPPEIPAQTRQVAIERLKSILTREMDRLKAARTAGVGGRIEGMSKVASGGRGWFGKLFAGAEVEGEVEEDEGLVWGGKGPFGWEDIDGVEIEWGCSALGMVNMAGTGAAKDGEQGNGLDEVRTFLWDL